MASSESTIRAQTRSSTCAFSGLVFNFSQAAEAVMRWRFCPRSIAVGGICLMATLAQGVRQHRRSRSLASARLTRNGRLPILSRRLGSRLPQPVNRPIQRNWGLERWGCRSNPAGFPAIISALSSLFRHPSGRTGSRVWGIPRGERQSLAATSRTPTRRCSVVFIRRQVLASQASERTRRLCLA